MIHMKLNRNIGTADRLVRLSIAILLFLLAYFLKSWIALLLGLFTLFEAAYGWCVMYQILGKSSCPYDKGIKK